MGYTTDDTMVRVDFFKSSGKWYTTEAMQWLDAPLIHDGFKNSLRHHLLSDPGRLHGMIAVCLLPDHENMHPLMMPVGYAFSGTDRWYSELPFFDE